LGISSPIESSKPFLFRGDYFGENRFLLGEMISLETFVVMRKTSICMIDKEFYDNFEILGSARARMISDNTYILSKTIINTDFTNDYSNRKSSHLFASKDTNENSTDGVFGPPSAEMIREDVDIFSKAIIGTDFVKGTHSSASDTNHHSSNGNEDKEPAKKSTSSCPCPTSCSSCCLVFSSFLDTFFIQKK
jgi:hypothetical protein